MATFAGEIHPKTRAWLCCGFLLEYDEDATEAELFAPEGETPVLVVPASWDACYVEGAAGWAIVDLYEQRYGWLALVRTINHWPRIAQDLGLCEMAAD